MYKKLDAKIEGNPMIEDQFMRSRLLLGDQAIEILQSARVLVFGLGGVGGFCAEALARAGIGRLSLVDRDTIAESNLNRQILALHSTIGRAKTAVMRERIRDINPTCEVQEYPLFYLPDTADQIDFSSYDYVIDAVDTVTAKIEIILQAKKTGVPLISCMGTGNKLDPSMLRIDDLSRTKICPLARVMRREMKKRGVIHQKVLFSLEKPRSVGRVPGSVSWVPSSAGLMIAGEAVLDLLEKEGLKIRA